ncbi:MAG: 4'-phosphopantetheinyl transferase family protein [Gammaproteobacteria bacterium]
MINTVTSPLRIAADCYQASCHFNKHLFQETTALQLGIALPSSLERAVQKRKAEFIAGRYCAQAALAQLDNALEAVIEIGAHREPLWPQGIVGSITHTEGYASALVAHRTNIRAIGIDSEAWIRPGSLDNDSRHILTSTEGYANHERLFDTPLHYLTLIFSAKESLFKCLFPIVNNFFDFHAAAIRPLPSSSATQGHFSFELLQDLNAEFRAGYSGQGTYVIEAGLVHTAIVLKA